METNTLAASGKEAYIEKAFDWLSKKPIADLKSTMEGHEDPKVFHKKDGDEYIQADFSFTKNRGGKYFADISLKTENPQRLVTKWKLLSLMANAKRGKLYLFAPKGHKMFTTRLVNKYSIIADIYSL